MEEKIARVVDVNLDTYILNQMGEKIEAKVRGNVKKKDQVLIGDIVSYSFVSNQYIIDKILPRKNSLIRPRVANIDNLVIIVSLIDPIPDYILLDKQIILCFQKNIHPIVCLNKVDLISKENNDIHYIEKVYKNRGIDVICTSAKDGRGIPELKKKLKGKISAFSGNSGVGKSSLTKMLLGNQKEEVVVNEVAKKTKRGRHTTKKATLFEIEKNTYILDTPGFSSYELFDIETKMLKKYYPEFNNVSCEFADCNHVNESSDFCNVKRLVEEEKIDRKRYERYVYLYTKLKEIEDKKYK